MTTSVEPITIAYVRDLKDNLQTDIFNAAIWGVNQLIEDILVPNLKSNADALYVEITCEEILEALKNSPIHKRYSHYVKKKWEELVNRLMEEFWHFEPQEIDGGFHIAIPLNKRM